MYLTMAGNSTWRGRGDKSIEQTSRTGGLGDWEEGGRGDEEQREEKRASAAGAGEAEPADGGSSFWSALHFSGAFSTKSSLFGSPHLVEDSELVVRG
jgi:hypothetical protein